MKHNRWRIRKVRHGRGYWHVTDPRCSLETGDPFTVPCRCTWTPNYAGAVAYVVAQLGRKR